MGKTAQNYHLRFCSPDDKEVNELYTADYIIQTVEKLVKRYGTRNPYDLCDAMHIVLYRKDLQKKLKGFFFYHCRQKSIVIDSNVNEILERILIAHELGHDSFYGLIEKYDRCVVDYSLIEDETVTNSM